MQTNDNEFFREATLRICGDLNVEQALLNCLNYMKDFIPADRLGFYVYDPVIGTFRTVAVVSPTEVLAPKTWKVLPMEWRKRVETLYRDCDYVITDRFADDEMARYLVEPYGIGHFAGLSVAVPVDWLDYCFAFVSHSVREGVYTDEHARLFRLLKQPFAVALSNCLRYRDLQEARDLLAEEYQRCQSELRCRATGSIIGEHLGLKAVMTSVRQVAHLDSPALLLGETGTGKELIAGAIHDLSSRRDGPFVKVNCGAIPDTLIDSELFGHEKGAFTGASSRKLGRFERADGGTIFLDEVGELPWEAQVRLLRVLQEKEFERVGGTEPVKVDIRIIAATNRDLRSMLDAGLFRPDLYFRLSVFPIRMPPLRERGEDIPALVQHFLRKKARDIKLPDVPTLAAGAIDRLMAYDWPGNVRELENAVERELIRSNGQPLAFADLLPQAPPRIVPAVPACESPSYLLDEVVAAHIERVLALTGGRVHGESGAARLLGINASTLRNRMNKLGLSYGRKFKSDPSE